MSDVFQEVQEEYRREQMAKLWVKYRIPLIGGAVALVLAVAGYEGWTYWRNEQAMASSRAFDAGLKLLDSDDQKAAAERFAKLSGKAVGGYKVLAKLQEAAIREQSGEQVVAAKLFDEVARDSSDPIIGDMATIRSGLILIETASLADMKTRFQPIASGKGPWRTAAAELLAYASWRAGKSDEALKLYGEIVAADSSPEKAKRRATEMKALIEGGMTLADLNKSLVNAPTSAPGASLLPFGLEPPKPDAPGSLLGPADMPALPDALQNPDDPLKPPTP